MIKMQSVLKIVNCERYNLFGGYMVVVFKKLYFFTEKKCKDSTESFIIFHIWFLLLLTN